MLIQFWLILNWISWSLSAIKCIYCSKGKTGQSAVNYALLKLRFPDTHHKETLWYFIKYITVQMMFFGGKCGGEMTAISDIMVVLFWFGFGFFFRFEIYLQEKYIYYKPHTLICVCMYSHIHTHADRFVHTHIRGGRKGNRKQTSVSFAQIQKRLLCSHIHVNAWNFPWRSNGKADELYNLHIDIKYFLFDTHCCRSCMNTCNHVGIIYCL